MRASKPMRVIANYWMWRLRIRRVLPNHYVQRVNVVECGEPLEKILPAGIILDSRVSNEHFARRSVIDALRIANSLLPDHLNISVIEAYRSRDRQKELWARAIKETLEKNPTADNKEVERLTNLVVANPNNKKGNGHQTGGAVDITLVDAQGHELPMGTEVQEFISATPTFADVPHEIRTRRQLLVTCMAKAGFTNYPGEWWHFSLGDQLWAAYRRQKTAKFGEIPHLETAH